MVSPITITTTTNNGSNSLSGKVTIRNTITDIDFDIMDRVRGALIGSALGDTIGLYTEFLTPEIAKDYYGPNQQFSLVEPVTKPYQDYHRDRFESCAWTDDTDHTLLIILSYLREGELKPEDLAKRLRVWCEQGLLVLNRLPLGLGNTVGSVVLNPDYLSNPTETAFEKWLRSEKYIAPNGSVMRTIPIGIICLQQTQSQQSQQSQQFQQTEQAATGTTDNDPELELENEVFRQAIRMGAITHADPRCALSVSIASALTRSLCLNKIHTESDINALLERAWSYVSTKYTNASPPIQTIMDKDEFSRHVYAERLEELELSDRQKMGYTYKCLGSAIWCLRKVLIGEETFKTAMVKLIMSGGDADTNGAVAGGLMGALAGYERLPSEWRDGLRHREWYNKKIDQLGVVLGLMEGVYEREEDKDTQMDGGRSGGMLSEEEMKRREMEVMEKILLAGKQRAEEAEAKRKAKSSSKKSWFNW
ncbi:hypothetical protein D9758_017846 [Tetrapyrgos nigripes]|uniref:ADP-ribosylglycohydrolase n=1 Tax=Tetrapyrgos nigripes TaxID=182062 RepID=A0A8H5F936_9AGAR|nr:hypothetical protein D9758_017846 [Tetrapyrgos nigripes]